MTYLLSSVDITNFYRKLAISVILGNTDQNCILIIMYNPFESPKVVLLNIIAILIVWAKLATPGILKRKYIETSLTSLSVTLYLMTLRLSHEVSVSTLATNFSHATQFISKIWTYHQSLVTLAFHWEQLW